MRNKILHKNDYIVVWWQFFLLKKWTKVRAKFFLFDSEFLILLLFQTPTASNNGRFSW
jgi:hypothetical protein